MSAQDTPKDPRLAKFDHFVAHCTATPPNVDVDDKWLDHLHGDIKGWSGRTGYHVLIGRDGTKYKKDKGHLMRDYRLAGAHVGHVGPGWNSRSFGIVLAGGVDENNKPVNNFTDAQWKAFEEECILFFKKHPKPHTVRAVGHRELLREHNGPPKACPCFNFSKWFDDNHILAKAGTDDQEDLKTPIPNGVDQLMTYTVQRGDALWKIARKYDTTVNEIMKTNPDLVVNLIFPGQVITLP